MEQLPARKKRSILMVLSLALAIIILDTTLLNVSLAAIVKDLHTDLQGIQWVITGYSLTLAALTVTGGRLGDLFGRKKMFMSGAVIFAIGSFITSVSRSVPEMIAGEAIIEGIGAALMMPATMSIMTATFRGKDRAMAFGIWGAVISAAAALGPIVGGFFTTYLDWRWGFRVNVVVAAALLLGASVIPESKDTEEKPTLDVVGVLLSAVGLTSFVYGVIQSSTYGWWEAKQAFSFGGRTFDLGGLSITPLAMLLGVAIIGLFIAWELRMDARGKTPLVSMKLFANRQFTSGSLLSAFMALGQSGVIFAIPVFLQSVAGLDALHTGYALLPMSFTLMIASPAGALLAGKVRPKPIVQTGLFINLVSALLLVRSFALESTAWSFAMPLALFGLGMGIMMSQISNFTLSAVSPEEAGEASGVNGTLRQIGQSFGSAIIGAVLVGALISSMTSGVKQSTTIPETVKPGILQEVASQGSGIEFGGLSTGSSRLSGPVANDLVRIAHQATVDADKRATWFGALFALLGLLVSLMLPDIAANKLEKEESLAAKH